MRKITLLFVIALTSLVVMACSFGGMILQNTTESPDVRPAAEDVAVEDTETEIQSEKLPAPTVDPIVEAKSCLENTWEINGLSDYVIAAVPPELAEEYDLQYEETSGQAYFILAPDGQITLNAENLEVLFTARYSIFEVPVTVRIDGTAIGDYDASATTLTTSNMDTSGLTASAQALNEDLIEPNQIINSIPFVKPPFNTAEYSCQGDVLILTLSGYPENIPPLVFEAAK